MIQELRISNYILVDRLDLDFSPGFNVITGETGTGKSILIGALKLVLGHRTDRGEIRKGCTSTVVEAVFDIGTTPVVRALLEETGIDVESDELVLSREVKSDGRSRCMVNARIVPASTLRTIGENLVDLHGQHQHQSLLHTSRQRDILDGYGGLEEHRRAFGGLLGEARSLQVKINGILRRRSDFEERKDFLRFQIDEIEASGLEDGEDVRLKEELSILENYEKIFAGMNEACAILRTESDSPLVGIFRLQAIFRELARFDVALSEHAERLTEISELLQESGYFCHSYREGLHHDPGRIEEINLRLDRINHLKRKYGGSIPAVLDRLRRLIEESDTMRREEDSLGSLQTGIEELELAIADKATALSAMRVEAGEKLARKVAAELSELGMPSAKFSVRIGRQPAEADQYGITCDGERYAATPFGIDHVEFFLSSNPGEDLKPLSVTASGGELSRIMLALKTTLAHVDGIPILVFDEIDAGIGGGSAGMVGQKLKRISGNHQVICITHLPLLTRGADRHFSVTKNIVDGRTVTSINFLGIDERVEEVARMLGGHVTETTLRHAKEILQA